MYNSRLLVLRVSEALREVEPVDRERRVPIVAMTANATPEGQSLCLEAGMNYFLSNPVAAGRLFDLIEQVPADLPVCQGTLDPRNV